MHNVLKKSRNDAISRFSPGIGARADHYPACAEWIQLIERFNPALGLTRNAKRFKFAL
jgi:putative component of membrane protein insertase Oxa1/YidC/SpoIIIJ protein YidD